MCITVKPSTKEKKKVGITDTTSAKTITPTANVIILVKIIAMQPSNEIIDSVKALTTFITTSTLILTYRHPLVKL